jgi:hypothetical protein
MENDDKIKKLKDSIFKEPRVVRLITVGDVDDVPVYDTHSRIKAAEELALIQGADSLPTLKNFFAHLILELNPLYDSDPFGTHHLSYLSDLKCIAKLIVSLGGEKALEETLCNEAFFCSSNAISNRRCSMGSQSENLAYVYKKLGNLKKIKEELKIIYSSSNNIFEKSLSVGVLSYLMDRRAIRILQSALYSYDNELHTCAKFFFERFPLAKTKKIIDNISNFSIKKKWWQFWI